VNDSSVPPIVHPVRVEGAAIVLRELAETDLDVLVAIFSDPLVVRYIALDPVTAEAEAVWLAETIAAATVTPRTQYHLSIEHRPGQSLVGTLRLGIDRPEHRSGEIGYALARQWWGKGLATEAVRLVVRFGFDQLRLHRIWATHHPDNPASGRVLQKAGMTLEGRLRGHMYTKGAWRDSLCYAVLETDDTRPTSVG